MLQIYSLPKRSVCLGGESVHPSQELKTLILSLKHCTKMRERDSLFSVRSKSRHGRKVGNKTTKKGK